MRNIFERLLSLMMSRGLAYTDQKGLQTHGWRFDSFQMTPDFSYNVYEWMLYIKYKSVEDYMDLFDPDFQKDLNAEFAIIGSDFDHDEYVLKLNLLTKLAKEIR